jgi:hypothetical protein
MRPDRGLRGRRRPGDDRQRSSCRSLPQHMPVAAVFPSVLGVVRVGEKRDVVLRRHQLDGGRDE